MVSTPTARIPFREKSSYTVWSMRSRALARREGSLPERWAFTVTSEVYRSVDVADAKEPAKSIKFDTDLYTPGLVIEFSGGRILCEPAGGSPKPSASGGNKKGLEIFQAFLASVRRP